MWRAFTIRKERWKSGRLARRRPCEGGWAVATVTLAGDAVPSPRSGLPGLPRAGGSAAPTRTSSLIPLGTRCPHRVQGSRVCPALGAARLQLGHPPLSLWRRGALTAFNSISELQTPDFAGKWPKIRSLDKSRSNRILHHVGPFLSITVGSAEVSIKVLSLPQPARFVSNRRDAPGTHRLEHLDPVSHLLCISRGSREEMDMVWHNYVPPHIPAIKFP